MIGVIVGSMAFLLFLSVIINAYVTTRRLATVLNDLEEILHSDFKGLEAKIDNTLTKLRIVEAKVNRE
jgi:hypothetical protein